MIKKFASFFAVAFLTICTAYGVAVDTSEPKTIIADKIEYNVKSGAVQTSGNTEIINKSGQRMTLKDSYLSNRGNSLSGDDIKLWLGNHVYVESDNITRNGDITVALGAEFTACQGCDTYGNAWTIDSAEIVHNKDTRMLHFYNSVFWVYDNLPVFWLPYFSMPDPGVKHKTGLLLPNFESTNNMGTQINIPVYFYLSDTHDMTFKLSYLTQENPLFQLEHRLNGNHSEYRSRGSYTYNKEGESRWHIFNNDVIELGEYARANIFLERASDKTYLQKYGFYDSQPYLDSGAKLELFGQSSYVVADAHIFQELRDSVAVYSNPDGNILPNIRGVYQTAPIFKETYMLFNADVLGISGKNTSSQRMIGDARIVSPWTLWGGNRLTLSLDARYDIYNFSDTIMADDNHAYSGLKTRFLPSGYVEWGLPLFKANTIWMQVLEPRVRMTMMQHTKSDVFALNNDSAGTFLSDATLFSNNRFSGYDLWENGTFADYGARWALFNKKDGRMFEIFLGQSYDFTNRADTDPNSGFHNGASDYVGRISFNNNTWFNLFSRFRFDQQDLALRHIETSSRLGTSRNFINVGHIWSQKFIDELTLDDDINEATVGIGVQLSDRWSTRFNSIYSITYNRFQSHSGGLFYNHPCYYMSLSYRRDNTIRAGYVGNTTFQFKFGISVDGVKY